MTTFSIIPSWSKQLAFFASACVFAVSFGGCTPAEDGAADGPADGAEPATATPMTDASATDASAADAVESVTGGTIKGMAKFSGEAPKRRVLDTKSDAKCNVMHADEPLLSEQAIVSADGGLKNVFIQVTNPPEGEYGPDPAGVTLDQLGCQYEPHVFGFVVGTELIITNSDDTLHNVRSFARRGRPFNLGQPAGSPPRKKTPKRVEDAVKIKCDVHPWMVAYMFITDHPFFAVSDDDGSFEISGLPAGEYEISAWHETFGKLDGKVTVPEDGAGELELTFSE